MTRSYDGHDINNFEDVLYWAEQKAAVIGEYFMWNFTDSPVYGYYHNEMHMGFEIGRDAAWEALEKALFNKELVPSSWEELRTSQIGVKECRIAIIDYFCGVEHGV